MRRFLQHVGIHQPINPIEKIITYYFFALLFAVILGGFITLAPHGLNFFKGNFWISVLLIGAPAWYFCHRKHREFSQVFEDEKRVYQSFLDILPLMQGVSLTDLGYHQKVRPKGNDDILCDYCDHRLSTQAHYCPHCGKSQHNNETDVDTVIVDAMVASHDGELGAESALMTAPSGRMSLQQRILLWHTLPRQLWLLNHRLPLILAEMLWMSFMPKWPSFVTIMKIR